jgi:hypothetical protein
MGRRPVRLRQSMLTTRGDEIPRWSQLLGGELLSQDNFGRAGSNATVDQVKQAYHVAVGQLDAKPGQPDDAMRPSPRFPAI